MSRMPTRWHFQPIKSLSARVTLLPVFLRKIVVILGNQIRHVPGPPACLRSSSQLANVLCEHHLRTQSTPVRRFDPYLQVEWLKFPNLIFIHANLSTSAIHCRCARVPSGTDRRPLSVATGRIKAPPGPPLTVLLPEKTKRKMSCVTVAFLTCFL